MRNFNEIIKKVNAKNSKSKSKYPNACDSLVEILYKKSQKLRRDEIINEMVKLRVEVDYESLEKFPQIVKDEDEQDAIIEKMWKTCKNGIDTAISDSRNNSSFSYNDKYSNLKLELKNGKYQIVDAK